MRLVVFASSHINIKIQAHLRLLPYTHSTFISNPLENTYLWLNIYGFFKSFAEIFCTHFSVIISVIKLMQLGAFGSYITQLVIKCSSSSLQSSIWSIHKHDYSNKTNNKYRINVFWMRWKAHTEDGVLHIKSASIRWTNSLIVKHLCVLSSSNRSCLSNIRLHFNGHHKNHVLCLAYDAP